MGNMSYCRFQNTMKDLRDCEEAGLLDLGSVEEAKAAVRLFELCQSIVDAYELKDLQRQIKELEEEDAELDDEGAA